MDKEKLAEELLKENLVTEEQVKEAFDYSLQGEREFPFSLLSLGYIEREKLNELLGKYYEGYSIALERLLSFPLILDSVAAEIALEYQFIPLKLEDNTLTIALSALSNRYLLEAIEELTGHKVKVLVPPPDLMRKFMERYKGSPYGKGLIRRGYGYNTLVIDDEKNGIRPLAFPHLMKELRASEWLRSALAEAIRSRSRKIKIVPDETDGSLVISKGDGGIFDHRVPASVYKKLERFFLDVGKVSRLGGTESLPGKLYLIGRERRLSLCITAKETVVGREFDLELFDEKLFSSSYEELMGEARLVKDRVERIVKRREGMLLVTGPEGGGKEEYLHCLIDYLKGAAEQITVVEERIWKKIEGITQIYPDGDKYANLAACVEEALMKPPEILVISDIKDREEAEMAFLSTARSFVVGCVSSGDSYALIEWLVENQLKPAVKAGLLKGIVAVHSFERLCDSCKVEYRPTETEARKFSLKDQPGRKLWTNKLCAGCRGGGHVLREPSSRRHGLP